MRKTNIVQYIFSIIIIISVTYNNDIKLWFKNNKLVKYENYLRSLPYYEQEHLTEKELKKIPKHQRPKPNAEFERLKTIDPELGRVPDERLFSALLETERRIIENQSGSFRDSTFTGGGAPYKTLKAAPSTSSSKPLGLVCACNPY